MLESNLRQSVVWGDAAARFHAEALAQSDYVAQVGGVVRAAFGPCAALLDVGAGCGSFGAALLDAAARWTAIEPNDFMQSAIRARAASRPTWRATVLGCRWQDAPAAALDGHALALCANIPGLTDNPLPLLARVRAVAPRVAWAVPAQAGPRRFCLSGLLPAALHGEDTTPGHTLTLAALGAGAAPRTLILVDWTFRCAVDSHAALRRRLAGSYAQPAWDAPDSELDRALRGALRETPAGLVAEVPKRSAVMLWGDA
jgi:hypothetical protein